MIGIEPMIKDFADTSDDVLSSDTSVYYVLSEPAVDLYYSILVHDPHKIRHS